MKLFAEFLSKGLMAALVLTAGAMASAAPVTLTDNGDGTATMANGLVTMTFSKTDGSVSAFYLAGLPTTNLIDPSQDYALGLTHIGSGTNDYWVSINSPGIPTYTVVTNTGQIVDVMLDNPIASGNVTLYPNGLWDWSEHHVMRAGEAGFYTYHVWRHRADQPQAYYTADSWQGRLNAIFSESTNADGSVNHAWDFCGTEPDVPIGYSVGANPPGSTSAGVPQEVVIMPYTNYFTQPSGTNYEPGWPAYTQPCGLTSALYPTWTKYDWTSYQGTSNSFRNAWGASTEQVGVWTLLGSAEFINGGPTKLKGTVSGNYMYNDDLEEHGLGTLPDPGAAAGEVFTKVIGPYFMYANTGTNHLQLWQDAQNMGAQMVSNWPYAWMDESETDYPRQRGMVTGTIMAKTGESTANPVVILGNADANAGDWLYQGVTNFLFWTTGDANGNFSIPKVRPGNYVLYSYVPGIWGELQISNIVVTANQTNSLGVIAWNPPHLQQRLWRVGTPDHTSHEFRFGSLQKQYGLWWRYLNEMGTNNLNFTIGQSVESNDWYYAQPEMWLTPQSGANNLTDHTQTNFVTWSPVWNVIFNLTSLPTTNVLCTVALAGCNGCYFYPYINGVNETPNIPNFSNPSQGVFTTSGDDIYRDVVGTGRYQYYQFSFPSSDFVVGTNTFSIHVRQPGTAGTYTITNVSVGYPDLVVGGLIYDFLQMETGPQVVSANPPAAPGGLAVMASSGCEIDLGWTNNATNVTGVVVERSTDGMNFTAIGATANNGTNYADTTLVPGATYYYELVANNVDGNSPPSNIAQTTTEAAEPPAVPGGLTATPVSTNQINLQWTDTSTNEDGFSLERSTNGANYTVLWMTAAGVTNYADIGLLPGTTYYYRVQAFRSCWGNSDYSTPASAMTLAPSAPVVPAGLFALPGNGQVSLSWVGAQGATSYNIKHSTVSGGPYTNLMNLSGTNYVDSGLNNGTTYYYVVSAVNAGGEGGNSREASATPLAQVTAIWTNLITSSARSWDASANWTNTANYPNGTGVVAVINANIAAGQTINVDQAINLGWLNIGDANGSSSYTLAPNGGTLTFNNGTNNGAGLVQSASSAGDIITVPIVLNDNLTVVNDASAHALTLSGTISGTNAVAYAGPGSVTLTGTNTYSGGTLISGATVSPANFGANSNGFGSGAITLDEGTLNLHSDNTTYNYDFWNLVVPTNTSGTLNADGRSYLRGTLTGGGTFYFNPPFVRVELDGDWSAFTGQIITSGSDFRVNNTFGLAKAALYLGGDGAYTIAASGAMTVGEISGSATAILSGTAWTVGGRNTTAVFAGVITGNSVTKVGTGTWIWTGNNTYTGSTTISGGAIQIGEGGASGTMGLNNSNNVTDNGSLIFNRYDTIVYGGVISGSGSLTQAGAGVLILSGVNSYSGATYVTAGTLVLTNGGTLTLSTNINLANGAVFDVGGGMILGNARTLSGDGTVNGNLTLVNAAALSPGNSDLGSLSFNNSLTLGTSDKTFLSVSHDAQTNNAIGVAGLFTRGGALVVSNADDPLAGGDVFKLFTAANVTGNFSSVTLPALTAGLYWDTNTFGVDGTIRVGVETPPVVGNVVLAGGKLVLSGTGGVTNGTYYVMTSTNVAAPLANWTRVMTNQFDGSGNFNFTNTINAGTPQSYYLLRLP